jgi:hypothetical protein
MLSPRLRKLSKRPRTTGAFLFLRQVLGGTAQNLSRLLPKIRSPGYVDLVRANLPAQQRLRGVQPKLHGIAEVALLSDRNEI